MYKVNKMYNPHPREQLGAMTLITVTLLLLLTSTIIVYTARVSLVKHRVSLNAQSKIIAENMATQGSFQLLSQISKQPQQEISKQTKVIEGQGQYAIEMQSTETPRFSNKMRVIEINALGNSEDNLASVSVSQLIIAYPLLRTLPQAPLIVRKSLSTDTKLTLVANPNGAGSGVALSLWTGSELDMTTLDVLTCELYEYLNSDCALAPLSGINTKNGDIIDNPEFFPEDLFAYLTNLPVKYRAQLMDEANTVISHCEDLNHLSSGLIWVKGDCELSKETTVGTIERPVMLIVEDASLAFAENSKILGLVLMLTPYDSIIAAQIDVNGPALIEGALIASESVAFKHLPLEIKYDAVVLNNIQNTSSNWRVAPVPNSWRNF